MLTDKIRLSGQESTDPEDYFASSLGVIFPDDITNQHGDLHHHVIYQSLKFGAIELHLADPKGEESRSLFSHFLWNAGLQLAEFIEEDTQWDVKDEVVLELGAGTGLSGIVASLAGAKKVVITDYPAPEVLANLRINVDEAITDELGRRDQECYVQGHEWGNVNGCEDSFVRTNKHAFSRILVADCLWMPWQHRNLMKSISWFLGPTGRAWVVAGFHTGRPKMAGFFEAAILKEEGLMVEKIWERDAEGKERAWVADRGTEDVTERKRWLVIAILKQADPF